MKNVLFIMLLFALCFPLEVCSQSFQWESIYNGPKDSLDIPNSIAVDASGNIYVTGLTTGLTTGPDFTTIKLDQNGEILWTRKFTENKWGRDIGFKVKVDANGNAIAAGWVSITDVSEMAVFKYSPEGDLLWFKTFNGTGSGEDYLYDLDLDDDGNVYVAGQTQSIANLDFCTIKYDSNGNLLWSAIWNGGSADIAQSLAVDNNGNVYVTGLSFGTTGTGQDFLTVKYNSAGQEQWSKRFNYSGNSGDQARFVAVDNSNNVYVCGYVTASAANFNYTIIKYNPAGDTVWTRYYDGGSNNVDQPLGMKVSESGYIVVTGMSAGTGIGGLDYTTVCYDTIGDQKWVQRYNYSTGIGPNDIPNAIVITNDGGVVVTGQSQEEGTTGYFDYATIKYDIETGSQRWLERWNGPKQTYDYGKSVAVGSNGTIYVTGQCNGPGSAFDWGTIKYSMATDLEETNNDIPSSFKLFQNYPNPFHSVTAIRYSLPEEGFVMLTVYNVFGEEVTKLVNKMKQAGSFNVDFDGSGLSSGAYYYRLQCEKYFQTNKMMLMK